MTTALRIIIILAVFYLGYTLGQGHKPFDYDGDGRVTKADLQGISNKLLP